MGSKGGMIRKSPISGLSFVPCLHAGKGDKGEPYQTNRLFFPFPHSRTGREEERAAK
jgi:hypothetical protein